MSFEVDDEWSFQRLASADRRTQESGVTSFRWRGEGDLIHRAVRDRTELHPRTLCGIMFSFPEGRKNMCVGDELVDCIHCISEGG